jgi:hypothetical protein
MWCVLWNAWLKGFDTNIIEEMDFCWATDHIDKFDKKYIFHNAGVVGEARETIFYKGEFISKYPYNIDIEKYDKSRASYKYLSFINSISDKTCLK